MSLFKSLKKYLFYVIDQRETPPATYMFETRGRAVGFAYKESQGTSRHHRSKDNVYIIPSSKGKASNQK